MKNGGPQYYTLSARKRSARLPCLMQSTKICLRSSQRNRITSVEKTFSRTSVEMVANRRSGDAGQQLQDAVTDRQKADLFCQIYAKVSRVEHSREDRPTTRHARKILKQEFGCNKENACSAFSLRQLRFGLRNLKNRKSPGHDEISNEMLKHPPPAAEETLLHLINHSWDSGNTPHGWRRAIIIPIFKGKGKAKENPSSYRQVALTSWTSKLAERLVATRLVYHLESKKKLAPCQAGFRRGRSTEEQLARVTQDIFDGLEAKELRRAALVLLDFSRAYDKTWKAALYMKLKDTVRTRGRKQVLLHCVHARSSGEQQ